MNGLKEVLCRKNHKCEKCGRIINAGQKAKRANSQFLNPIYRCMECGLTKAELMDLIDEEIENFQEQ